MAGEVEVIKETESDAGIWLAMAFRLKEKEWRHMCG